MNVAFIRNAVSSWWFMLAGIALTAIVVRPVVEQWAIPQVAGAFTDGTVGVLVVSVLGAPYYNVDKLRSTTDYTVVRSVTPLAHAIGCGISVAACFGLAAVSDAPTPLDGPLAETSAVLVVAAVTYWYVRRIRRRLFGRVLTVEDPGWAIELVERCDAALADETLDDVRKTALRLTLSGALIAISAHADQEDMLPEAFDMLEEAYESAPPAYALTVGVQFAEAVEVKWLRTGDRHGYDEALNSMLALAEEAQGQDPDALAKALAVRGAMLTRRAERAQRDGDGTEEDWLRTAAASDLREAVALSPPGSIGRAQATIALARAEGPQPLAGNLDTAIKSCRRALRTLYVIGYEQRAAGQFAMAQLLELRANLYPDGGLFGKLWPNRPKHWAIQWLWPERCTNDLAVAAFLYFRLSSGGAYKQEARLRFPAAHQRLVEKAFTGAVPSGRRWMYQALYANQLTATPGGAVEVALAWAGVAMDSGDKRQAAQAWWSWITAVSSDLRRRVLHDKEARLGHVQSLVATAAWWMFDAGKAREAAVTLELGRAVLLTERIQRAPGEMEARLRAAGQPELADRWREAGEALQREDRARLGTATGGEDPSSYSSLEYHALVEHEWLLREISELDGFPDIDATAGYDDLRAAAAEGPVVYLATTSDSGFALVVTADAQDPVSVPLPELTRQLTDALVADVRGAQALSDVARTMRMVLPELRRIVHEPLSAALPEDALVTLIATGPLGELPLHAAACVADERGVWRDHGAGRVFRYAPNARVLLRSQRIAREIGGRGLRVLTAAAPRVPGEAELKHAEVESRHVARLFGDALSERPEPATVDAVESQLERCPVWHFACHGVHEPARPLDSRLLLADGGLDLRAILSRSGGEGRLAVLSACQTANVDGMRPDEVVGFPSALLQAGLAGVISCQGEVDDGGAMLIVLRFFESFVRTPDVHPARALAAAQEWVRTSTNADFEAAFPQSYAKPEDASPRWESVTPFAAPATWVRFDYTGA